MFVNFWMSDRIFSKHITFKSTHDTPYSYFLNVLLEYKRECTFLLLYVAVCFSSWVMIYPKM